MSPKQKLPTELTIFTIKSAWPILHSHYVNLNTNESAPLDFSDVEEIDSCGAQALWFIREKLLEKNIEFNLLRVHDDVKNSLSILGMQALIGDA